MVEEPPLKSMMEEEVERVGLQNLRAWSEGNTPAMVENQKEEESAEEWEGTKLGYQYLRRHRRMREMRYLQRK